MTATATSIKLDAETKERVRKLAEARRRSPHWIMREAIAQYVAEEEWRREFYEAGMESWEDYKRTGLHVTHEEFEAWFDTLDAGERVPPPECHT